MFQWLRSLEGDRLVYGENFFVEPFDPRSPEGCQLDLVPPR